MGTVTILSGVDADIASIRDWVKRSGLSNSAIAADAGVDEKQVRLLKEQKDWNPKADTVRAFVRALPKGWRAGDAIPDAVKARAAA